MKAESNAREKIPIPYPGIRPFEEKDDAIFFGRQRQIGSLLRKLEEHRFVAVVGSSGSGKSSLVKAGLFPAVRRGFLMETDRWKIVLTRPGHSPYRSLAARLWEGHPKDPQEEVANFPRLLRRSASGLLDLLPRVPGMAGRNLLLVIDQFEELFAFRRSSTGSGDFASRAEASSFVSMLLHSCKSPESQVRVILTMRSDFIGECEAFLGLPEAVSSSQFLVPRLEAREMEEAIIRPGTVQGEGFEPFSIPTELVNQIINEAGDRPDQLPLMQHALMRTWKAAATRAKLEQTSVVVGRIDYQEVGGIDWALSRHAEQAWQEVESDERLKVLCRQMFLLLCDVSDDGQIVRRRPRVAEVEKATGGSREEIERIIRHFRADDRNFLLPELGPGQALDPDDRLDVVHESLLRRWVTFEEWLKAERRDVAELGRVEDRIATGEMLSDKDLARLATWQTTATLAWARRYLESSTPPGADKSPEARWQTIQTLIGNSAKAAGEARETERRNQETARLLEIAQQKNTILADARSEAEAATLRAKSDSRAAIRKAWWINGSIIFLALAAGFTFAWFAKSWAEQTKKDATRLAAKIVEESEKELEDLKKALKEQTDYNIAQDFHFRLADSQDLAKQVSDDPTLDLFVSSYESLKKAAGVYFPSDKTTWKAVQNEDNLDLESLRTNDSVRGYLLRHAGELKASVEAKLEAARIGNQSRRLSVLGEAQVQMDSYAKLVNSAKILELPLEDQLRAGQAELEGKVKALQEELTNLATPDATQVISRQSAQVIQGAGKINDIEFGPTGLMFGADEGKTVSVWKIDTAGSLVPVSSKASGSPLSDIAIRPDGRQLAAGSTGSTVRLYALDPAGNLGSVTPYQRHRDSITSVAYSQDGKLVASTSADGNVRAFNSTTLVTVYISTWQKTIHNKVRFCNSWTGPGGMPMLVFSSDSGNIQVSDINTLKHWATKYDSPAKNPEFSPDDRYVVCAGEKSLFRVWNAATGSVAQEIRHENGGHVGRATFRPGNHPRTAVAACWQDGSVSISTFVAAETATLVTLPTTHVGRCTYVAWSYDGRWLASSGDDGTVLLWDFLPGQPKLTAKLQTDRAVSFCRWSPDGSWLASVGDGEALLWPLKAITSGN